MKRFYRDGIASTNTYDPGDISEKKAGKKKAGKKKAGKKKAGKKKAGKKK